MLEWLRPVISAKYVDLYPIYKEYTEKISLTNDKNIAKHSLTLLMGLFIIFRYTLSRKIYGLHLLGLLRTFGQTLLYQYSRPN